MPLSREVVQSGVVPGIADMIAALGRSAAQVRTARINANIREQDQAHQERIKNVAGFKPVVTEAERRARSEETGDLVGALSGGPDSLAPLAFHQEGVNVNELREINTDMGRQSMLHAPSNADAEDAKAIGPGGNILNSGIYAALTESNRLAASADSPEEFAHVQTYQDADLLNQGVDPGALSVFAAENAALFADQGDADTRAQAVEQISLLQNQLAKEQQQGDATGAQQTMEQIKSIQAELETLQSAPDFNARMANLPIEPFAEGDSRLNKVAAFSVARINAAAGPISHPISTHAYEKVLLDMSEELGAQMSVGAKKAMDEALVTRLQRGDPYYMAMNDVDPNGQLGTTRLNVDINGAMTSWTGKRSDIGVTSPVVTPTATGLMQKDRLLTRTQAEAMGVLMDHMAVRAEVARALVSGDKDQVDVAFANMKSRGLFRTGGGKSGAVEAVLEAFGTRNTPTTERDPITGIVLPEPNGPALSFIPSLNAPDILESFGIVPTRGRDVSGRDITQAAGLRPGGGFSTNAAFNRSQEEADANAVRMRQSLEQVANPGGRGALAPLSTSNNISAKDLNSIRAFLNQQ